MRARTFNAGPCLASYSKLVLVQGAVVNTSVIPVSNIFLRLAACARQPKSAHRKEGERGPYGGAATTATTTFRAFMLALLCGKNRLLPAGDDDVPPRPGPLLLLREDGDAGRARKAARKERSELFLESPPLVFSSPSGLG